MSTIRQIIESKRKYIIPIYQRNYEWTDVEINQLVDDITHSKSDNYHYHIGSLILFKKSHDTYEVVDGQQRLTTIALLLYCLKNKDNFSLEFASRPHYNQALDKLKQSDTLAIEHIDNDLIYTINHFIQQNKNINKDFLEKLLEKVDLSQCILPEGTNVTHYFERMNNGGKQLEKQSVLRAKFLKSLNDDKTKFSKWDNCAKLDEYTNTEFSKTESKTPISLKKIITETTNDIKSNPTISEVSKSYDSIIDFPNFLMIALRIFKNDGNIPLNDEQLLEAFGYYKDKWIIDPSEFLKNLCTLKTLFDRFIIKRSLRDSEPYWILKESEEGINTFSRTAVVESDNHFDTDIQKIQTKIVKIQSMLHAAYPSNNYKNWLFEALNFIWENHESLDNNIAEFGVKYLTFLEVYAKDQFEAQMDMEKYLPKENGLSIPRIVFYYTDYLLWKFYFENIRGKKKLSNDFSDLLKRLSTHIDTNKFNNFNFRSFSSIEHLYPQNPDNRARIDETILNSFGNLCLISRNANSKYSNLEPIAKRAHSNNSNLNESLKQSIMFNSFNVDTWGELEIQNHQEEIQALILHYTK